MAEETDTSGNMQRDYIFGVYPEQGRRAGRRVAWRDSSGNVYYYFADAIGSTRAVTNSSGTACFEADYYPYGQENDYVNTCSPTYKFTGYEFDSETGNYYAGVYPERSRRTRYYNPRLGRFMSADPLGGAVGNPQSLNRYAYVINSPESFVDPWGLQCIQASSVLGTESKTGQFVPTTDLGSTTSGNSCQEHQPPPIPEPELVGDCSTTWGIICQMEIDYVAYLLDFVPGPFAGASSTATPKPKPQTQEQQRRGFLACTSTGKVGASWGETALDAVGIIPGANDIVHGAQIVSAIGAAGISLFGDVTGAGLSAAGAGLEIAKDTGTVIAVHGVEMVPIVGNFVSAGATIHDIYGMTKAYGACMSGGG